ncbi:uncharacterized protein LOC130442811 isoform X1 [Diorhabda sublineata]|uniref:uncharacterized protein LOC130442811 isoform X1 n=1 Tax=Diorhabda sublineata TaxID=1163346 RepID=UPI0024E0AB95|nr:uncharacterized protein LOC130442811 isoform X1 [Diorhabda sublineata]
MGKKARKTRWRTLEITDEQSDSEESHITNNSPKLSKTFQQKSYCNKLPYSSQSTPRRKFQHDSTKSTRSSSTASENKITFNEDEYTRITTPRQDVLFKKGYLSKPKTYQMQTSTGTSTTSASNSTGNGTPDHQSTDLEYDSQFVFPNGFVDHNGIYYVNSFEPYPLMLYNPPTYYTEITNPKSKRYSIGSLTESTSPNNEEATSQDLSGGETNNVSDYNGHNVFNMVYPGYYLNGVCPPQEVEVGDYPTEQTRKIKKRRRRKTSRSQNNTQGSTECSDEDEEINDDEKSPTTVPISNATECTKAEESCKINEDVIEKVENEEKTISSIETASTDEVKSTAEAQKSLKYDLKPDAEEFVPRAFRTPEIPLSPVQFIKVPPNFVPIPVVPFNGQVNPSFIPPGGIPINFIPPDPKIFPNFINFVSSPPKNEENTGKQQENKKVTTHEQNKNVCHTVSNTAKCDTNLQTEKLAEKVITNSKTIDIATVVSKLEEAAKEQENKEENTTKIDAEQSPKKRPFRNNQKYKNSFKRNFYISSRNSPQNGDTHVTESNEIKHIHQEGQNEFQIEEKFIKNSPERFRRNWKAHSNTNPKWQQKSPKQNPKQMEDIKNAATTNRINNSQLESPKLVQTSPKTSQPKLPDQWISVSSRKKRKTKNLEENDVTFDDTTPIEEDKDDQFESYDVNLLVDVIPPSKMEEETLTVEITEEKIEEIINNIAQTESDNIQNNCLTSDVKLVTEIENEMIVKEDIEKKEEVTTVVSSDIIEEIEVTEDNNITKKKSKKNSQKPVTKKVIITDIDLSDKFDIPKTPIKKIVKKVDKQLQNVEVIGVEEDCEEIEAPVKTEVIEQVEVKKGKKKKKKPSKAVIASSLSSSTSTLPVTEDAYDILLDTHLAVETGKTNDEISMELNKLIQKGMYSNLEEKMKSLNITEGDGFFKSIFSKIPLSEKAEATGFLKSPDFTKIPLFKADPVSDEQSLESKQTNDQLNASDSPEVFLEHPDRREEETQDIPEEPKSLYPITEAVKEWMCRTRETTPDVEIFKNPSIIYKEFCDSKNSDTEIVLNVLSDEQSVSVEEDDEEITLFTSKDANSSDENTEDFLEYWEDLKTDDQISVKSNDDVNKIDDEDELEVYESKYGKNEDFLNLQQEIRQKSNISIPKRNDLPHRAVCCNIM